MLWRYLRTQRDSVVVGTRCGINLALARSAPAGVNSCSRSICTSAALGPRCEGSTAAGIPAPQS